ncbi:hypothetical protein AB0O01_00105 [Streptomyces sp. NPDC093252]|uniref:hypothetical protein n=1 Tax=Streptomyces sp. NPDC093252 TaxID=3154980 RepID=UPI00341809C8
MTKRKANAGRPRLVPAIVVADATEIGTSPGVLVVRTGPFTRAPKVFTVPAELVGSFLSKLHEAACAAEEEYWHFLPAFRAGAASDDNAELARAKEKWLLSQPWQQEMQRVLGAKRDRLFFMDYAGHVGVVTAAPYSTAPHLLIFDPLQLHRLAPAFQQAAARAWHSLPATLADPAQRLAAAQREWASVPWPRATVTLPTQQQAEKVITGLRTEFLRRTPLIKEH